MEKEIEDTKGIEVEAETLQELVRANAIERERYKEEMDAEAMNWRVKLESLEKQYDDRNEALKKEYNRKLEEWSYDFAHNKKKELNKWELEFNVKKEKESETLKERWRELNADRKELQNEQEAFDKMTEEVESFPARLQEAVDKAKADVKARLEQSYHFKSEAIKKDCEINTKVLEEQVKSLTLKADELKAQNIDLREALEQANSRVQIIAKEAITGSASQKFTINTGNEKEGK